MIRIIELAPQVVAIEMRGKVKVAELEDVITLLEAALERNKKTHVFAEVEDFRGIGLEALSGYLPRVIALLGKLDRFGRIAVVSDQKWVRSWTMIESALLPRISYKMYHTDEREVALDWVRGRRTRPHGPALTIIETDKPNVIGFELHGKVTAEEAAAAVDYFSAAARKHEQVRLLVRIKRIGGAALESYLDSDNLRKKLQIMDRLERYAIVGGPAWVAAWVRVIDPLLTADIRHFSAEDEYVAWQWLEATPKDEKPLAA